MDSDYVEPLCARHPERLLECDCCRITQEISGIEELPDHVNLLTMCRGCKDWAESAPTTGNPDHLALPNGTFVRANAFDIHLPKAECGGFQWPFEAAGGYLVMIVNQWVEDEPDAGLASALRASSGWDTIQSNFELPTGSDFDAEKVMRVYLNTFGLPTTPSSVRYALQTVNPQKFDYQLPGPTRGVMVQSFFFTGNPGFTASHVVVNPTWGTTRLCVEASALPARHQEWWCGLLTHRRVVIPPKWMRIYEDANREAEEDADCQVFQSRANLCRYAAVGALLTSEAPLPVKRKQSGRPIDPLTLYLLTEAEKASELTAINLALGKVAAEMELKLGRSLTDAEEAAERKKLQQRLTSHRKKNIKSVN